MMSRSRESTPSDSMTLFDLGPGSALIVSRFMRRLAPQSLCSGRKRVLRKIQRGERASQPGGVPFIGRDWVVTVTSDDTAPCITAHGQQAGVTTDWNMTTPGEEETLSIDHVGEALRPPYPQDKFEITNLHE